MPTINLSDEEFEHLKLLLSAEIDAKQYYVRMVRSVISHFKSVPKSTVQKAKPYEMPATAIIDKPSKRRGRPPKNKTAEPSVTAAHSVSQPQSVPIMRLEDDFIARTAQVDPNARKKKRRRRANYRRKGVVLGYMSNSMSRYPVAITKLQEVNTALPETEKENNPVYQ